MNECDWLDQVAADLQALAAEIKASSAQAAGERRSLEAALRSATIPNAALAALPGLPRKAALIAALAKGASAVDATSASVLKALEEAQAALLSLKRCCPEELGPATVVLTSLAMGQAEVVRGNPVQATVTLSGPAPGGDAVVSLASSDTNVATVPPGVKVPAGKNSATFDVTTLRLFNATVQVTITASWEGVSKTAHLTVIGTVT